jgi:hypothetical protein
MTSPQPHPAPQSSRYLLPALATVLYVALVIAAFGFLSLFLGRDVIAESDAGTLLGPAMVAAAAAVTFVALVRVADRRTPWGAVLAATTSTFIVMIAVGAFLYAWGRGELVWLLIYSAQQARSPFVIAAALLAGITVVSLWAVSPRSAGRDRGIDRSGPRG